MTDRTRDTNRELIVRANKTGIALTYYNPYERLQASPLRWLKWDGVRPLKPPINETEEAP